LGWLSEKLISYDKANLAFSFIRYNCLEVFDLVTTFRAGNYSFYLAALVAVLATSASPVAAGDFGQSQEQLQASAPDNPRLQAYLLKFDRDVYSNWAPYKARPKEGAITLAYSISPDGEVESVITAAQGRIEENFAIMDAILSEPSPGKVPSSLIKFDAAGKAQNIKGRIDFFSKLVFMAFGHGVFGDSQRFFAARPELKGKVVIFHALPLSILHYYPGIFKSTELHDAANMRPVSIDRLCSTRPYPRESGYIFPRLTAGLLFKDARMLSLYKDWQEYFKSHKTTTRAALLAQRAKMEKKYAMLFEK